MTADELYPTPTRRWLAAAIARGDVQHYHWQKPKTLWGARQVNASVQEMVKYGVASLGDAVPGHHSTVRLTTAGEQWLANAGGEPR